MNDRFPKASLFLTITVALVGGCGKQPSAPSASTSIGETSASRALQASLPRAAFPLTVTDGLDRQVRLEHAPARIVSLAPKNTELLFALGAGDWVVGVTSYCNYPPQAKSRAHIGGFSVKSQSLEKIVALKPDLVVAAGELQRSVIPELERVRIPVLALGAESLEGLYGELELLGRVTSHENDAVRLIEGLKSRVAAVRAIARTIKPEERKTVFFHIWSDPLTAAGPGSYLGELIPICGAINMIDDAKQRYPHISQEVLLARDPEVILAPSAEEKPMTLERLRNRPGWSTLRAVKNGHVHLIDGDLTSRCGPRLVDALEIMAHAIYPDRFPAVPDQTRVIGSIEPEPRP